MKEFERNCMTFITFLEEFLSGIELSGKRNLDSAEGIMNEILRCQFSSTITIAVSLFSFQSE